MTSASPIGPHSDGFKVRTYETREEMGRIAADHVASWLRHLLTRQSTVRMVFAAAPSQADMLDVLAQQPDVAWQRITAFHMDEYIGLPANDTARFGQWLERHIFSRVPFGRVHVMNPGADPDVAALEYASLLAEAPIDVVCAGVGVNGHIAFNDPPADFNDPADVKVVDLDVACRQQQVDENCFSSFDAVPRRAMTLSVPRLMASERVFTIVPGEIKRAAVRRMLLDDVSSDCPATILRTHPNCSVYLDRESNPSNDATTGSRAVFNLPRDRSRS